VRLCPEPDTLFAYFPSLPTHPTSLHQVPQARLLQLRRRLDEWLGRLEGYKATLDMRDDLTKRRERVRDAWQLVNPLVFDASLGLTPDLALGSGASGASSSTASAALVSGGHPTDVDALQALVAGVDALCQGPAESELSRAALLRQQVKGGLHNRAWEGSVVACMDIAAGMRDRYAWARSCFAPCTHVCEECPQVPAPIPGIVMRRPGGNRNRRVPHSKALALEVVPLQLRTRVLSGVRSPRPL
jgi:hypothetical protein